MKWNKDNCHLSWIAYVGLVLREFEAWKEKKKKKKKRKEKKKKKKRKEKEKKRRKNKKSIYFPRQTSVFPI